MSSDKRWFSERDIETAFIDSHWNYGLLIHETSAEALYAALGEGSEPSTGHPLFARLYGEYAATLETLAALAIAVRERSVPGSLLRMYVTYPLGSVKAFYNDVQSHDGDLSDLLRLPSPETLIALATARQADVGANIDQFAASLDGLYGRLKEASRRSLDDDRLQVLVYNRTKHGASMLRLFEPDNDLTFEFVMPNPKGSEPPYQFAQFTVNREEADKLLNNVREMTASIRELGIIVKLLSDADLLFRNDSS